MKSASLYFVVFCVISSVALAKDPQQKMQKPQGMPNATLLNISNISSWYSNTGKDEHNPFTGNSGLTFPRGTSTAVFTSGLMFGTIASDGISSNPRIFGHSYQSAFLPGAIIGIRTGVTENPNDVNVRIWRVRKDYATANLTMDAAEYFMKSSSSVTESDIQTIRAQYKKDWQEWPAVKGAPFYDANNDGIYTPQFETVDGKEIPKLFPLADEPGLAKADQVIWYVCNDIGTVESPWRTKPVGLEQQVTIWGYNSAGIPGDIIYKKYKLIYKGTAVTPEGSHLNNSYVAHWSDPDIGDAVDDFAGCDTVLSVGFAYNAKTLDSEYRKFNLAPPSIGYDFLQGPIVVSPGDTAIFDLKKKTGHKNLPMTSFIYFASGGTYSDPPFTLNGSYQWYSMMQGLPPTPQPPPYPSPVIDPITGKSTNFWLSGDPITQTGWIDGVIDPPNDRRILQSSGPFSMALGDTQEIVVGVVVGLGEDRLESIVKMKENDRYVQFMYNSLFAVVPPSVSAIVSYPNSSEASVLIKAEAAIGQLLAISASLGSSSILLFDDGTHGDQTANDGVYTNSITIDRSEVPLGIDVSFTDVNNRTFKIPKIVERVTIAGDLSVVNAQVLFDNINNDGMVNNGEFVHYIFTLKNNTPFALSGAKALINSSTTFGKEYKFGAIASGSESSVANESFFTFRLPVNYSDPNYKIKILLTDDKGNLWHSTWTFPVVQQNFIADSLTNITANIVGNNDGRVGFILYDNARVGEKYDIWYGGQGNIRNWTVVKPMPNSDYAKIGATLLATNQVPPITTLPNAKGYGTFTINDAKTEVNYSITVSGLTGVITGAHIHTGAAWSNGSIVHPFVVIDNTIQDGVWLIPDSLVDDFISGNLYVNVHTATNPGGEIRGQIADGLLPRRLLPAATILPPPLFSFEENRLIGFSLYVAPADIGVKRVQQTAPTVGEIILQPNPEGTYQIIGPVEFLKGDRINGTNIEIRFVAGINYAVAIRGDIPPTAANTKFIQVPFAVYQDTIRAWPVIKVANNTDTLWNADAANLLYDGKFTFDNIVGIVDTVTSGGAPIDIRYYSSNFPSFPPNLNVWKTRLISSANHNLKDIFFVNEKNDGIPPAMGTTVLFTQYQPIVPGDIKSITLQTLSVEVEQVSSVPQDFSLSQNYPNPFNPVTKIEFSLAQQINVTLKIFDILGREVTTLLNEEKSAGRFVVEWNGKNSFDRQVASGIYFYQISAGSFVQSKKMIMLK